MNVKFSDKTLPGFFLQGKGRWAPLAKSYLNILVDEIVVQDKAATIRGSYAALAGTMQAMQKAKVGNLLEQVPTFNLNWCAGRDSNS